MRRWRNSWADLPVIADPIFGCPIYGRIEIPWGESRSDKEVSNILRNESKTGSEHLTISKKTIGCYNLYYDSLGDKILGSGSGSESDPFNSFKYLQKYVSRIESNLDVYEDDQSTKFSLINNFPYKFCGTFTECLNDFDPTSEVTITSVHTPIAKRDDVADNIGDSDVYLNERIENIFNFIVNNFYIFVNNLDDWNAQYFTWKSSDGTINTYQYEIVYLNSRFTSSFTCDAAFKNSFDSAKAYSLFRNSKNKYIQCSFTISFSFSDYFPYSLSYIFTEKMFIDCDMTLTFNQEDYFEAYSNNSMSFDLFTDYGGPPLLSDSDINVIINGTGSLHERTQSSSNCPKKYWPTLSFYSQLLCVTKYVNYSVSFNVSNCVAHVNLNPLSYSDNYRYQHYNSNFDVQFNGTLRPFFENQSGDCPESGSSQFRLFASPFGIYENCVMNCNYSGNTNIKSCSFVCPTKYHSDVLDCSVSESKLIGEDCEISYLLSECFQETANGEE